MIVLAVFALAQRSEASKQRHAARVQADAALGQKELAQRQRLAALHQRQIAIQQTKRAKVAKSAAVVSAANAKASQRRAQLEEQRAKSSAAQAKQSEESANRNAAAAQASALDARKARAKAVQLQHFAEGQTSSRRGRPCSPRSAQYVAIASAELTVDPVEEREGRACRGGPRDIAPRRGCIARLAAEPVGSRDPRGRRWAAQLRCLQPRRVARRDRRGRRRRSNLPDAVSHDRPLVERRLIRREGRVQPGWQGARRRDGRSQGAARRRRDRRRDAHTPTQRRRARPGLCGGGRYLVTGSADNSTRIWDPSTGDLLYKLDGTAAQQTIARSPDGSLVAVVLEGTEQCRRLRRGKRDPRRVSAAAGRGDRSRVLPERQVPRDDRPPQRLRLGHEHVAVAAHARRPRGRDRRRRLRVRRARRHRQHRQLRPCVGPGDGDGCSSHSAGSTSRRCWRSR